MHEKKQSSKRLLCLKACWNLVLFAATIVNTSSSTEATGPRIRNSNTHKLAQPCPLESGIIPTSIVSSYHHRRSRFLFSSQILCRGGEGLRFYDIPRGGSDESESEEEDDEVDSEDDSNDDTVEVEDKDEDDNKNKKDAASPEMQSEYDDESEDYSDEYTTDDEEEKDSGKNISVDTTIDKYDEPLVPSPMMSLFTTFGVMMLAKRVDLFSPTMVRIARFAFIGYIVSLQLFLLYVRIRAKQINDRTSISLTNPLSSLLRAQLESGSNGGGGGMVKNLASSFLSSSSTVLEYDLKQAKTMQGGLLFNMAFMWFIHFKMEQVQPLLIQSANGFINMVYSPLFQVYIMGRNLERPFKNPAAPMQPEASMTEEQSETTESKISAADDDSSLALEQSKGDSVDAGKKQKTESSRTKLAKEQARESDDDDDDDDDNDNENDNDSADEESDEESDNSDDDDSEVD